MDRDPFDLIGHVLEGQFRVDSFAGEGDLTAVYKGHHVGVDAPVAIKLLNLPSTLDRELARPLVDTFEESSRVHYRLACGTLNIAQSIASGMTVLPRTGVAAPYLVREWFEGESLASNLTRRRAESRGGRPIEDALALLETAFEGVAYAHGQGDVHLALNPSNLFLARRGDAVSLRVLDFGIGRSMNAFASASRPEGGLRVLFPAYAAPEQLDQAIGKPGAWTDVYALALVTMEVLSDRLVMAEQETGALVARALDPDRRPSPHAHGLELPRELDLALTRAVSRAPDRRQESAAVLWRDIKGAVGGATSRSGTSPAPASAKARRLVKVPPPPAAGADGPPRSALPRPGTLMGMGISSVTAGKPSSPTPSVQTLPMTFEPVSLPTAGADTGAGRVAESVSTLAISVDRSPIEPLAHSTSPAGSPSEPAPPPRRRRSTRRLLAVVGALLSTSLLVAGIGSLRGRRPAGDQKPVAAAMPAAPAAPAESTTPAEPAEPTEPASSVPSPEPVASESVPVPTPTKPFTAFAARRALDATAREILRCRRDKTWGVAQAKVTFEGDGSVGGVALGIPFAGTPSGACVADELSAARIAPFPGKARVIVYQFFVAPK